MSLNTRLLQIYQCTTLDELLRDSSIAFSQIGFPHVVLKWTPAAASKLTMRRNSSIVWSNLPESFGAQAAEISAALQNSVEIGLEKARSDTLECQNWRLKRKGFYQLTGDAPKPFFLTEFQKTIICDFGEPEWREFFVLPLSRERERTLILEAKTQDQISSQIRDDVRAIFSVFACVYQCLHRPDVLTLQRKHRSQSLLSRRELQCLQWLAAGKTLSEAALILDISERTLRFHVSNAKQTLGVSTTMQAVVAAALQYGFDPKDPRNSIYQASRSQSLTSVRRVG